LIADFIRKRGRAITPHFFGTVGLNNQAIGVRAVLSRLSQGRKVGQVFSAATTNEFLSAIR
jgi:hypothetical protein